MSEVKEVKQARWLLSLFGDYLRPRVKAIRPKGYEKPSADDSDIRFEAWLRIVTTPRYNEYETDLLAVYVRCDAHPMTVERVGEFELALVQSLVDRPFVHRRVEQSADKSFALVPISAAAMALSVDPDTVLRWTNKGLPSLKKGAYYWVNFLAARDWQDKYGYKPKANGKAA